MNEWNMKVTHPLNRVWTHPNGYMEGTVVTANGIVSVYSQGSAEQVPSTNLHVVCNGRLYSRTIDKRFTYRRLVTLANRFAQEVFDANA